MKNIGRDVFTRQRGLTYLEVLIAAVLLALTLVPALDALLTAVSGTAVHESYVVDHHRLSSRMEEVLADPFSDLDAEAQAIGSPSTPTAYSDAGGTPGRVLVFLSRYDGDDADADGDPFTGGDAGLLWVQTAVENTDYELETLIAQ